MSTTILTSTYKNITFTNKFTICQLATVNKLLFIDNLKSKNKEINMPSRSSLKDHIEKLNNLKSQVISLSDTSKRIHRLGKQFEKNRIFLKNYGSKLGVKLSNKNFQVVIDELQSKIIEVD
jgi:hypothetical protein